VHGTLLVAHQHVAQAVLKSVKGIVNRHNGAAGIPKQGVDALGDQRHDQRFCASHGRG